MQADTFYGEHLKKVEKLSDSLLAVCLGQDISLFEILEDPLLYGSYELAANHIAERLTFCLSEISPSADDEELHRARDWLFGILFFLRSSCPRSDFTFRSIKKVMNCPLYTRQGMFTETREQYRILRAESTPPSLLERYDEAVLLLLDACGLLRGVLEKYKYYFSVLPRLD